MFRALTTASAVGTGHIAAVSLSLPAEADQRSGLIPITIPGPVWSEVSRNSDYSCSCCPSP